MEAARRRGKHIGRPSRLKLEEAPLAHTKIKSGTATLTDIAKQFGCSPPNLVTGHQTHQGRYLMQKPERIGYFSQKP
jgi:DNA invertase Pin-like site-specific DNA recombinase